VKNCIKEMKTLKSPKDIPNMKAEVVCDMSYEVYLMSKCVLKNNYINCPNVTATEECKEMVKYVNCSEDYEKLLQNYRKVTSV
jgi:hypothetical protein